MAISKLKLPADASEKAAEKIEFPEAYSDDGVDVTLIQWMLELPPLERLAAAQDMIDTVWMLREAAESP